MNTNVFKNKLLQALQLSGNSLFIDIMASENEDSIFFTYRDYTKFSLEIHESNFQKVMEENPMSDSDRSVSKLLTNIANMHEDNPLFFTIFLTLFELHNMDIITKTDFQILMERVGEYREQLKYGTND